jgi:rubrerythrin
MLNPTNCSTADVLENAIEAEKESLREYLDWAWQTRDPAGKNVFVRLASEEFEHMLLLEAQRSALKGTGECRPAPVPVSLVERLVPRIPEKSMQIRGTAGQTELSALQVALEHEERTARFYSEQARAAGDPAAAGMFKRLGEMEQAHVALIKAELDNIQRDGFWFDVREFTLESER